MRGRLDSAVVGEFADGFDPVNELADRAPGFVWRLQTGGHARLVEDLPGPCDERGVAVRTAPAGAR